MSEAIKVEVMAPALPAGYDYTGEYRLLEGGERYFSGLEVRQVAPNGTTVYEHLVVKESVKIIDPFDSSNDVDLEFSNNGGKWYLFNRRDMRFCKSAPYAYRNAELCLDFERCRVRQNHRFARVEGTRLPEGLHCVLHSPSSLSGIVSLSTGGQCNEDRIASVEVEGSAGGYKYEWE